MESGVASPLDGMIAEVLVKKGEAVDAGDVLVRFMKDEAHSINPEPREDPGAAHRSL